MKIRLLILIIFAFIFSSCSDFSGNEDAVEASLKPAPVTRTNNNDDDDDTCDECSSGSYDSSNDGWDYDGDGACDAGDDDDDDDDQPPEESGK